jgi:hypothetical protein
MGTINITGTGGIIEGNLGAANVNVNLDATLDFDGVNDNVDLNYGSGVNPYAGMSVSAWVNIEDRAASDTELFLAADLGTNQRFYLATRSGYWSYGYQDSGYATGGIAVKQNTWTHICLTTTNGAQKLYVNGVESTAQARTNSTSFVLATDIYLGSYPSGAPFFDGKIADVKIFTDVLSQPEVAQLASKINCDSATFGIDNLTAWWKPPSRATEYPPTNSRGGDGSELNTLRGPTWGPYCPPNGGGEDGNSPSQ